MKTINVQELHEEVFSITNHQGNANQNHKASLMSVRVAVIKPEKRSPGKAVKKKQNQQKPAACS